MRVTATDAKNRFGALCQLAKRAPVVVEKAGQPDTVLLSYADYQQLTQAAPATLRAQRAQFKQAHGAWVQALNAHHDAHGHWSDDLRTW